MYSINWSGYSENKKDYIKNNYNKQLLFTHSLHLTNILLYKLWKDIFYIYQ